MEDTKKIIELLLDIKADISHLGERITALEERVSRLEERMTALEERMTALEERMTVQEDRLDSEVSRLDRKIDAVQVTLETVTNKEIRLLAEGYAALNEKLDKALQPNPAIEQIQVRLQVVEQDVQTVKDRMRTAGIC